MVANPDLVPIGEAARRLGVAASTLRYYDERGVARPAQRVAGRRMYGRDELRRLAFVQMTQRLGVDLDTIAAMLDDAGPPWRSVVERHLAWLEDRITRAESAKQILRHSRSCPHPRPWRSCPYLLRVLDDWLDDPDQLSAAAAAAQAITMNDHRWPDPGLPAVGDQRTPAEPAQEAVGMPSGDLTLDNGPATRSGPATSRRLVELSHVIRHGMITYPGLPGPQITDHLSRDESRDHYAPGVEFQIGRISMVANTGTYLDTPAHRYPDGADLAGAPLERLVDLDGLVVRADGVTAISPEQLEPRRVAGRAVLLHTGWDARFGAERYAAVDHPYLTEDGAVWLVEQGATLVGIDSVNIDRTGPAASGARPAHSVLLAAGIPIVEHLRGLEQLPDSGFRFTAAPPMVAGMGSFPVRAYAIVG